MHAHRDLLQLAGTFLAGVPSAAIEWSLQASRKGAVVRDRVLYWAGQRDRSDNAEAFARVGAFLRALNAPDEMLATQRRLAPHSIRQGLGLAPGAETCLYIHHVEPDSGVEHCDAWKWRAGGTAQHSFYEFHFLPFTPAGTAPVDLIHPELRPLYASLEADRRIAALSGFWLRHRGRGQVDQISLTYPWQPAIREVAPLLPFREELQAWDGHHFRHIAMNGMEAPEPALTFYFSGEIRGRWPVDVADMHERVRQSARAANRAVEEQVFARLPNGSHTTTIGGGTRDVGGDAELLTRLAPALSEVIRPGASVYVIGCGWGAVGSFLTRTHRCRVVGITDDREQYTHCAARGLRTRYGHSEHTLPPGRFDSILVLDGAADLETLHVFGESIVVRTPDDRLVNVGRGFSRASARLGDESR